MTKKINTRSRIIIVLTIIALLSVGIVTTLSVLFTTPRAIPNATVVDVLGEPDYLVKIEWEKVIGSKYYEIEYFYSLYPDELHSIESEDTYVYIERIKGDLSFRIRALSSNRNKSTEFSEWKIFVVPALKLPILKHFNFIALEEGWKVDYNFSPVTYVYKGETETVNFYEVSDNLGEGNIDILSWIEIQELFFTFPEGEITYRFRPVIFTYFNGVRIDEPKELYDLYEEVTAYVEITYINVG